jgi:hypothetical protein
MNKETAIPEFGIKREHEERRDGGCGIVFDPVSQKYAVGKEHMNGSFRLFSGGVNPQEDIQKGILREVTEESGLYDFLYVEKISQAFYSLLQFTTKGKSGRSRYLFSRDS